MERFLFIFEDFRDEGIIPCLRRLVEQAIVKAVGGDTAQMLMHDQRHLIFPDDTDFVFSFTTVNDVM